MNKTEKLKNIILSRYGSIREFSKIVGIPSTTLTSALDRDIGGMAVDRVIKICDVLDLNVKTFEPLDTHSKESILSKEESMILFNFNKLNDLGKNEANKRVAELTEIAKYSYTHETKHNDESYIPTTFAAHDDSDPEIAKHDADVARKFLSKIKKK
ncbi:MAG TPA: XRE family transcriptional regulator [Clostridium sp.]|nr:XRE family transcriptional regulator [Clostridium sp.]